MAHNLVSYTAVADKSDSNCTVLDNCLVATFDDAADELRRALLGNLVLGLVTSAAGQLNLLQQIGAIRGALNMSG